MGSVLEHALQRKILSAFLARWFVSTIRRLLGNLETWRLAERAECVIKAYVFLTFLVACWGIVEFALGLTWSYGLDGLQRLRAFAFRHEEPFLSKLPSLWKMPSQ